MGSIIIVNVSNSGGIIIMLVQIDIMPRDIRLLVVIDHVLSIIRVYTQVGGACVRGRVRVWVWLLVLVWLWLWV